jgi:hypothetical protein
LGPVRPIAALCRGCCVGLMEDVAQPERSAAMQATALAAA